MTVRGLQEAEELAAYFYLTAAHFGVADGSAETAERYRRETTEGPEYRPGQVRGAFRDGAFAGGYVMHDRRMRVGAALVSTACIGEVVTHRAHRGSGVGRALMEDAIAEATRRGHGLLLLDGIPRFYGRFGFVDVWDLTEQTIDRAAIDALPPSTYRLRRAAPEDAEALLDLYNRSFARYTGSFVRTLEVQRHYVSSFPKSSGPVLAVDGAGRPRGTLLQQQREPWRAEEVMVADWPAALALLHYHADQMEGRDAIHWALPSESAIAQALADRIRLPRVVGRRSKSLGGVVSQTYHQPDEGWVGRPADLSTLVRSLLPAWRARWSVSTRPWCGAFHLTIGERSFDVTLEDEALCGGEPSRTVRLTAGALTQLVFGYHDVTYIAGSEGNEVPGDLRAALEVLFPPGNAWIAGSDAF